MTNSTPGPVWAPNTSNNDPLLLELRAVRTYVFWLLAVQVIALVLAVVAVALST